MTLTLEIDDIICGQKRKCRNELKSPSKFFSTKFFKHQTEGSNRAVIELQRSFVERSCNAELTYIQKDLFEDFFCDNGTNFVGVRANVFVATALKKIAFDYRPRSPRLKRQLLFSRKRMRFKFPADTCVIWSNI